MVFFGILEIYAREFSPKDDWVLTEKLSYLRHNLGISCPKLHRILKKITKWEIEFNGDEVSIFIPKFKELMDESTLKKLRQKEQSFRNRSGIIPKSGTTDADADADADADVDVEEEKEKEKEKENKESTCCAKVNFSFSSFEFFWDAFADKRGKAVAIKSWQKIPNLNKELCKKIVEGAKRYALERKNILVKGGIPKMAQGWLTDRRWEDEIMPQISKPRTETEKKNKLFQAYLQDEVQNETAGCKSENVIDIKNSPETASPVVGTLSRERTDS